MIKTIQICNKKKITKFLKENSLKIIKEKHVYNRDGKQCGYEFTYSCLTKDNILESLNNFKQYKGVM